MLPHVLHGSIQGRLEVRPGKCLASYSVLYSNFIMTRLKSFTHADLYALDEKGFNIITPLIVVNGSNPELDIVSDDTNIVVSVNYEYDTAFVMGDWVRFDS